MRKNALDKQLRQNKKRHSVSTTTAYYMTGRDYVRELVRTRDNHTCQECGKVWQWWSGKRRHDVHHLNGLCGKKSQKADKIGEMDGLITLCHKCHYHRHDFSLNIKKSLLTGVDVL